MRTDIQARLKERMQAEDPAHGVFFAQEIHALRQENLVLGTRALLRRAKLNRLQLADQE